jgi:hypothetical protein
MLSGRSETGAGADAAPDWQPTTAKAVAAIVVNT